MKAKVFVCYISTVFVVLGFAFCLMNGWIAFAVLLGLIFAVCLVWFCKILESGEKWSYRKIKRHDKDIYSIKEDIRIIKEALDGKEDKKMNVDLKNVHPGSRPSEAYKAMIGGKALDGRAENQTSQGSE